MANAIYPKYKEALLSASSNIDMTVEDVKISLIDSDEISYNSTHEFYSDLNANGIVATETLTVNTLTDGAVKADDVTFSNVSGDSIESVLIWIDTANASTSRLVAWLDTITGLPYTPDGNNIDIQWNASGIFKL